MGGSRWTLRRNETGRTPSSARATFADELRRRPTCDPRRGSRRRPPRRRTNGNRTRIAATGQPARILAGLLLAHLQSVLDGCDGELARVRFQQSAIGEWLDTIVDDALNLAVVVALGVGIARMEGSTLWLVIGLLAAGML